MDRTGRSYMSTNQDTQPMEKAWNMDKNGHEDWKGVVDTYRLSYLLLECLFDPTSPMCIRLLDLLQILQNHMYKFSW